MDNISGGMKSLCEDIVRGHEDRDKYAKQLRRQTESVRDNVGEFLADSKKSHEEMSEKLRRDLQGVKEKLIKNVNILKERFGNREKEIRTDLAKASKNWNEMSRTLKNKKMRSLHLAGK